MPKANSAVSILCFHSSSQLRRVLTRKRLQQGGIHPLNLLRLLWVLSTSSTSTCCCCYCCCCIVISLSAGMLYTTTSSSRCNMVTAETTHLASVILPQLNHTFRPTHRTRNAARRSAPNQRHFYTWAAARKRLLLHQNLFGDPPPPRPSCSSLVPGVPSVHA